MRVRSSVRRGGSCAGGRELGPKARVPSGRRGVREQPVECELRRTMGRFQGEVLQDADVQKVRARFRRGTDE